MTFAQANAWRDRFAAVQFFAKSGHWTIRFHQELAVNRVLETVRVDRDRVLLALDVTRRTPRLRLKYRGSIADAVADLSTPEEIDRVFSGFQKYLYQQSTV